MIRNVPRETTEPTHTLVGHLTGRRAEIHRLLGAFRAREPRLLHGAASSGKSALIAATLDRLNPRERLCILAPSPAPTPGTLAAELLRLFAAAGDPIASAALRRNASLSARKQSAVLLDALSSAPYWIVLDHFPRLTRPLARTLKHILTRAKTPIYLCANSIAPADIGAAASLFWCSELRFPLGPLSIASARALVERKTRNLKLPATELADFRASILRTSGRLPGSILQLCALAKQPAYRSQAHLKTALLQIDARISSHHPSSQSHRFASKTTTRGSAQ
jgi:hypothetical protein